MDEPGGFHAAVVIVLQLPTPEAKIHAAHAGLPRSARLDFEAMA